MKILFIGDIVGKPGRRAVSLILSGFIKSRSIDFVIACGENSAGGLGITPEIARELNSMGIGCITGGNHIWKRKEIMDFMNNEIIVRPANYPDVPGRGHRVYTVKKTRVAVINLQGRTFMEPIDDPFRSVDSILEKTKDIGIKIVDIHAEATSEKMAMGFYLDGKVSAVVGTHTHVQTSDARILPEGTGYITDAGMTGSKTGVIGVRKEEIIKKYLTGLPFRFKVAKGNEFLEGVLFDIDEVSGKCTKIEPQRISVKEFL